MVETYQNLPADQFEHSVFLISKDEDPVTTFNALMNRHIFLANLKGDDTMKFAQISGKNLVSQFELARREPALAPLFKALYYKWIMELGVTRAKDGKEREQQQVMVRGQGGDGTGYSISNRPPSGEGNIIDDLLHRRKKQDNQQQQ